MLPFTGSSQLQQQQTSNYPRPPRATDDPSRHSTVSAAPVGGGRAWPGFETTRRAKLAARTARGRAAAHGRRKQPGPEQQREGRCTRYGPLHPLRGAAPDQKRCTAYGSGAAHPITRTNAESARREPGCGTRGRRQGLAGLRDDAPSRRLAARTSRGRAAAHGRTKQPGPEQQREGHCTRYGPLHPIRRGALPTDRVQHTQSQEQTRNLRDASQAAAPVGDGRALPDNEPTRRAKLAARTARGRAAAHGRVKQPGPQPPISRHSTSRRRGHPRR